MDFFFFARKVCGHRKNLHWFSGSVGKKKKKRLSQDNHHAEYHYLQWEIIKLFLNVAFSLFLDLTISVYLAITPSMASIISWITWQLLLTPKEVSKVFCDSSLGPFRIQLAIMQLSLSPSHTCIHTTHTQS